MESSSNFQNPESNNKSEDILDNEALKIKNIKKDRDHLNQSKKLQHRQSMSIDDIDATNASVHPSGKLENVGIVYPSTNGGIERIGIGTEVNPYTIKIADEAITTERIKNNSVTTDKIKRGTTNTILITNKEGYVKWASFNESGAIMGPTKYGMLQKTGSGTEKNPYTLGITPSKSFGILTTDENGNVNWDLLKGDVNMSPGSGHINVTALNGNPLSQDHFQKDSLLQWNGEEWGPSDPKWNIKTGRGLQISGNGTKENPYEIRISEKGNIGIGEFTREDPPTEKLDINGSLRIRFLPMGDKESGYVGTHTDGALRKMPEYAPRLLNIKQTDQVTTKLTEDIDLFINTNEYPNDGYKRQVFLPCTSSIGKVIYLKKNGNYTSNLYADRLKVYNYSGTTEYSDVLAGETVIMVYLGDDKWLRLMTSRNYS